MRIEDVVKRNTTWLQKDLELKISKIHGFGVFARNTIKMGSVISVFGGKVYKDEEIIKMPEHSYVRNASSQLNNDFFLGPIDNMNIEYGFFVNHSCEPNSRISDSVFLVTIKDVFPGQEICFDYAHSHNKYIDMTCNCQSTLCRKIIKSSDYLDPEFKRNNYMYYTEWLKKLS